MNQDLASQADAFLESAVGALADLAKDFVRENQMAAAGAVGGVASVLDVIRTELLVDVEAVDLDRDIRERVATEDAA